MYFPTNNDEHRRFSGFHAFVRFILLFCESAAPFLGILGAMEYGIDYNLFRIVRKEDGVRKTPDKRATIVLVNNWIYPRMSFD